MKGVVGVIAGALCAVAIACASHHQVATQSMPAAPPRADLAKPQSPQDDEIDRLARDIEAQRVEMNLPAQAPCADASCARNAHDAMAAGAAAPVEPATCPRSESTTCKQSCTLADSICGNAKKICEISNQLVGDEWAARKCADGSATCSAARARCCECK